MTEHLFDEPQWQVEATGRRVKKVNLTPKDSRLATVRTLCYSNTPFNAATVASLLDISPIDAERLVQHALRKGWAIVHAEAGAPEGSVLGEFRIKRKVK